MWFTKNSDSEFSNNRSMQKTSKDLGCLFSVVVPGYCLLIFLLHCFCPEPGSRDQNVGGTGWTRWTVRQGGRKLGSDQCWHERSRKEFDRPWKVLWFVCLSLEKVINFLLRAAPRKYQLDVEIVKKWPGLKLSQNKALWALVTKSLV